MVHTRFIYLRLHELKEMRDLIMLYPINSYVNITKIYIYKYVVIYYIYKKTSASISQLQRGIRKKKKYAYRVLCPCVMIINYYTNEMVEFSIMNFKH